MNTSLNYAACSITGLLLWVFFSSCQFLSAPSIPIALYPAALPRQVWGQPLQILPRKPPRHRGAATTGDAQTICHWGTGVDARLAASTEKQICCCFPQIPPWSPVAGSWWLPARRYPGDSAAAPAEHGTGHAPPGQGRGQRAGSTAAGSVSRTAPLYCFKGTFRMPRDGHPRGAAQGSPGPAGSSFSRRLAAPWTARAARPCGRADPAAATGDPSRASASPGTPTPHPPRASPSGPEPAALGLPRRVFLPPAPQTNRARPRRPRPLTAAPGAPPGQAAASPPARRRRL